MNNQFQAAKTICQRLQQEGFQAFVVGGAVRDMVLGLQPKDFDITTNATPEQTQQIFPKTIPLGIEFGTVVVIQNGEQIEVTTFRKESGSSDKRHPDQIQFTQHIEEDIKRRDLTINGLLFDPVTEQVIDLVGGISDLKKHQIRTIGNPHKRFSEDSLRLLRAIRFAARMNFQIEPQTAQAIKQMKHEIVHVSADRLRQELSKMIQKNHHARSFQMLQTFEFLPIILPAIQPQHFSDIQTRLAALDQCNNTNTAISFAMLLANNTKEEVKKQLQRSKFSNRKQNLILQIIHNIQHGKQFPNLTTAQQKEFLAQQNINTILQAINMLAQQDPQWQNTAAHISQKLQQWDSQDINPKPLLNGKDLKNMGLQPGPIFKQILSQLRILQLNEQITNKQQAIKWIQKQFFNR